MRKPNTVPTGMFQTTPCDVGEILRSASGNKYTRYPKCQDSSSLHMIALTPAHDFCLHMLALRAPIHKGWLDPRRQRCVAKRWPIHQPLPFASGAAYAQTNRIACDAPHNCSSRLLGRTARPTPFLRHVNLGQQALHRAILVAHTVQGAPLLPQGGEDELQRARLGVSPP